MDYKLTFEDGSDAILTHHGVKGMHWGIWNPETRARYTEEGRMPPAGGGGSDEDEEEKKRQEEHEQELRDKREMYTERKRRSKEYHMESSLNKSEYNGDVEGYRKAQERTDAFYGRKGKQAQATEAKRRRTSAENKTKKLLSSGFKKDANGVWVSPTAQRRKN